MKTPLLGRFLLIFLSIALVVTSAVASSRKFKNAPLHADNAAWYVGSWAGTNLAFDPPLNVEITILPSGEVYAYSHGGGKGYRVSTHGKVIKLRKLADTPIRGKMQSASAMMLEDGGILKIDPVNEGLQTTAEKLGIIVQYEAVSDRQQLAEIQQRVLDQKSSEPHHKDNDFWHSPEFWGAVVAGAVINADNHDDHVTLENSGVSQADIQSLQKYYK